MRVIWVMSMDPAQARHIVTSTREDASRGCTDAFALILTLIAMTGTDYKVRSEILACFSEFDGREQNCPGG